MNVRIEDSNGSIIFQGAFPNDQPMDPEAIMLEQIEEECQEVSWHEELNGCYDYRVIFFDDLNNPDSIASSGGFVIIE